MNNYFETHDKANCNGCGVCALRCPKKAIEMQYDDEGFLYPVINKDKCINCGLCKKICSNNPTKNEYKSKAYAAKNKDENQRLNSTSGGMFKLISEYILANDGAVFGAAFDKDFNVIHDYATTIKECQKFSNSKYVRSDLKDSYKKVEEFLKAGKKVLFTGTPCQNYGLKKFLLKEYDNLILCEIICHSNPSPLVFKLYKENLESKYKSKIIEYKFRNKNNKPYAKFDNGKTEYTNIYNTAFNELLFSRPSCTNCSFCDKNRIALDFDA